MVTSWCTPGGVGGCGWGEEHLDKWQKSSKLISSPSVISRKCWKSLYLNVYVSSTGPSTSVHKHKGSSFLRLLHMCKFNYLSRDYLCGDHHFQSLSDMTRAGAALPSSLSLLAGLLQKSIPKREHWINRVHKVALVKCWGKWVSYIMYRENKSWNNVNAGGFCRIAVSCDWV